MQCSSTLCLHSVCVCGPCRYKPQPGVAVVMCPQTHAQMEQSVSRAITMSFNDRNCSHFRVLRLTYCSMKVASTWSVQLSQGNLRNSEDQKQIKSE